MEISDSPAYQAFLRSRAAFTGELGVRTLEAWREINTVSWHLAHLNTEAWCYTVHELMHCTDPFQPGAVLLKQLHPAVERVRAWQDRVLDLLGGAQAEVAAIAEAWVPTVRYAAAAVPD
ncbi:MAG: hypothetical protein JWP59_4228 [Massilia sp.]|jgi:hypothetical protein|nr:hypothetical protein [Massilia sp.]